MSYIIKEFHPKEATEQDWKQYFTFYEKTFHELHPNDPLSNLDVEKDFMINPHPHWTFHRWAIYKNKSLKELIGRGALWYQNEQSPEFNGVKEKIYGYITIAKNFRRKGLASELLKILVMRAKELGKSILRAETYTDSARAFCRNFAGKIVAERASNRLYLKDVNWNLMNQWREEGKKNAVGVQLEVYETIPNSFLADFCQLYTQASADGPAGDLAGAQIITPERRRIDEKTAKEKNYNWVTIISKEKDGTLSGLTEVFFNISNPHLIEQELTGVLKPYRGRDLGKWLKAEMLFYIKEHFPTAKYIDAGNNDINAPILSINTRIGFKRHQNQTFFEFDLNDLSKRLGI